MALTQNPNVGLLNATAATTSFVVPTPSGFQAGSVLFLVLNLDSKSAAVTAPSGWTLDQDIQTSAALGNRTRTYWRVADGSEGADQTFTLDRAQRGSATMLEFIGADTANPIAAKATANNSTSSTSQSAPSVASATAGGILICSMSAFINGSYLPPAGMTEVSDQANVDTTTSVATLAGLGATATGSKTFTASTASASIATSTIIKAAPATSASVPAGSAGDLLFAETSFNSSAAFPTISPGQSGWTLIDSATLNASPGLQVATFFRIATASEPASYDFYGSGATGTGNAFIRRFAGPWAASPLDAHGTQQGSTGSVTAPSVTVSQDGSLAVMTAAWNSATSVNAPSGYTAGGSASNGNFKHTSFEKSSVAAGATGPVTATLSFGGAANVGLIAIFTPYVASVTSSRALPASVRIATQEVRALAASVRIATQQARSAPAAVRIGASSSRTVPDAVRIATQEVRAIAAAARIAAQEARSLPAGLGIQTTEIRAAGAALAIQATEARSAPAGLNLSAGASRAVPAGLNLGGGGAQALPAGVAVAERVARQIAAAVRIGAEARRAVPAGLGIQTAGVRLAPAALRVQASEVRTIPDAIRIALQSARSVPAGLNLAAPLPATIRAVAPGRPTRAIAAPHVLQAAAGPRSLQGRSWLVYRALQSTAPGRPLTAVAAITPEG